ncbi:MAG: DNA alkylation repair protein [Ruminococcus sp.]|nr:DNA alkylation repair protein [Ruminococcus sp.]
MNIQEKLYAVCDEKYKSFSCGLITNIPQESIIGVRTPDLKMIAGEIISQKAEKPFLENLPHEYFEENQLHSFIISRIKNYDELILRLDEFLPFVDNWAVCDQLRPQIFKRHRDKLTDNIKIWINSDKAYTVRFAVGMLMCHYLGDDFKPEYLSLVSDVKSDEYYVNMMTAWYFATALAKQYEYALPYIENNLLDLWVHNKTIQKAAESCRIPDEHKKYLKTLKRSVKK